MNKIHLLAATILAVSSVQAQTDIPLTNGDFEAGVTFFGGFSGDPDIPGWSNFGTVTDGGSEGGAAWWGPYDGFSAFIATNGGQGAYNLSDYTIQDGDVFTLSFAAKSWSGGGSQIKVTLFYDVPGTPSSPTNVISTFTQDVTGAPYVIYTFDSIAATAGSVGGKLGVIIEKPPGVMVDDVIVPYEAIAWDEVTLSVTAIPEPSTYAALVGALALGAVAVRRRRRA